MTDKLVTPQTEKGVSEIIRLRSFLVDGTAPTTTELVAMVKARKINSAFKDARLISADSSDNRLTISFPNSEEVHVFVLILIAKGIEKGIFGISPSDHFFKGEQLSSFRLDTQQFAVLEEIDQEKSIATLRLNYANSYPTERKEKYTDLVKEVVKETMPQLGASLDEFRFT